MAYSKFHNKKVGGFDSKKEKHRAFELKMLEKKGIIQNLRMQVKYELIPSQYISGKCVERSCSYIADFVYKEDGKEVVEDVKGMRTNEYIIKRKLMLYIHKIKIKET